MKICVLSLRSFILVISFLLNPHFGFAKNICGQYLSSKSDFSELITNEIIHSRFLLSNMIGYNDEAIININGIQDLKDIPDESLNNLSVFIYYQMLSVFESNTFHFDLSDFEKSKMIFLSIDKDTIISLIYENLKMASLSSQDQKYLTYSQFLSSFGDYKVTSAFFSLYGISLIVVPPLVGFCEPAINRDLIYTITGIGAFVGSGLLANAACVWTNGKETHKSQQEFALKVFEEAHRSLR